MKNITVQLVSEDDMKSITSQPAEILGSEKSLLAEAQTEVELTYAAQVDARKNFIEAFKGIAQLDKAIYKEAEKKFQSYKKAITRAIKSREIAEQTAQQAYNKTLITANEVYREAIQKALADCQQATKNAGMVLKASLPGTENHQDHQFLKLFQRLYLSTISALKNASWRVKCRLDRNYKTIYFRVRMWLQQLNHILIWCISRCARQIRHFFTKIGCKVSSVFSLFNS
jgi:hypothetical protein